MLDQDARTETSALPEPTVAPRASRTKRAVLAAIIAVIAAVALASAGFAVGRASDGGGSSGAVTTRPASAPEKSAPVTKNTVPTLAFGEALEAQPDKPLDNATRAALAADLVAARAQALRYPTVASARAAGFIQAGLFAPGAGAHFLGPGALRPDGSIDPTRPSAYIYDGISLNSRIVGLMYSSLDNAAPKGFPGPNDHWHLHRNVCFKVVDGKISTPFAPDRDIPKAQCDAAHGTFLKKTTWMVHAWVVPGWESPAGVFSHANPDLRCADGTMNTDKVGYCQGT
jgi:hypothetical protein